MSDGLEITEVPEAPKKEEIEASPEKQTEAKEAAEQSEKTQTAVENPAELIEKGSYQESEALQEALTFAVDAVPEARSEMKTESSSKAEVIEAAQQAKDGPRAAAVVTQAESLEASQSAASLEQVSLDGKGDDTPDMVLVDSEGNTDEPQIDWGQDDVEQAGDLHQPSKEGGSPGDDMWSANQGEGIGNLAGSNDLEPGSEVELPDPRSPGGGKKPGELGGPNIGTDQMGELGDLSAAAAFGADGRIGSGLDDAMDELTHQENLMKLGVGDADAAASALGNAMQEKGKAMGGDAGKLTELAGKQTSGEALTSEEEAYLAEKAAEAAAASDSGDSGESGEKVEEDTSTESYDPEGNAGTTPSNHDAYEEFLAARPTIRPETVDTAELMMQPVDDETGNRPPPQIEFDRSSQVDPYAQYTGEETGGFGVIPAGEVDVDGNLIDPPDLSAGTETGFVQMDTDNKTRNNADLEDGEDLEAMDGKGP